MGQTGWNWHEGDSNKNNHALLYNSGMLKSIFEQTARQSSKWIGYTTG